MPNSSFTSSGASVRRCRRRGRWLRGLLFRAQHWRGDLWSWPWNRMRSAILKLMTTLRHDGIRIVDMENKDGSQQPSDFVRRVKAVLEWLAEKDPIRYRRIKREVRFIVNVHDGLSWGSFYRRTGECLVDWQEVTADGAEDWYQIRLSLVIIHEATHGHLFSRCIPYEGALRLRVERACYREEERHARHHYGARWREVTPEYDEKALEEALDCYAAEWRKVMLENLRNHWRREKKPPEAGRLSSPCP